MENTTTPIWTGQEVDGYQVYQPDGGGNVEIWDGGDYRIVTLLSGATEPEVRAAIIGYRAGRVDGERRGRIQLQSEFRRLLDAPSIYDVRSRSGEGA